MRLIDSGYWLSQVPYMVPLLGVYLVALALGIAYRRRAPAAAWLTIAAALVSIVTTLTVFVVQGWMLDQMRAGGGRTYLLWVPAVIGTAGRVIGTALLVAAIFTGRSPASSVNDIRHERDDQPVFRRGRGPSDTRIQPE